MERELELLAVPEDKVEVGDKVVINLEKSVVEKLQDGHGNWVSSMEKYLGEKGEVQCIGKNGDVHIKFKYNKYRYNPAAVAKVLSKGDIVKISTNIDKAKFLQVNHGGWASDMKKILGEIGKVYNVASNYDVMVKFGVVRVRLNPMLCTVISKGSDDSSSDDDSDPDLPSLLPELFKQLAFGGKPAAVARKGDVYNIVVNLEMKGNGSLRAESQQYAIKSSENPCQPCLLCSEMKQLVKFEPCGHLKICVECHNKNKQMKKCIECKKEIITCSLPQTEEVKSGHGFQPGDKVIIDMDEGIFHEQEVKYNPDLKDFLTKIGIVGENSKKHKVHVIFEEKGYLVPAESLKKVNVMNIEEI